MESTVTVQFAGAPGNVACLRCGRLLDVTNITVLVETPDPEADGAVCGLDLCPLCLAAAIEMATGFKAVRQVTAWYRVRDLAAQAKGLANQDKAG